MNAPLTLPTTLPLALALLRTLSLAEWRHHPWRHLLALLAVALGVALGFAVHLINGSALDEFGTAVRQVGFARLSGLRLRNVVDYLESLIGDQIDAGKFSVFSNRL